MYSVEYFKISYSERELAIVVDDLNKANNSDFRNEL